jgi:hypothetical protein
MTKSLTQLQVRWFIYSGNNTLYGCIMWDYFWSLVVRVSGYRSRGLGFDSQCYQIFWKVVDLERSLLSLMRITEELLDWKVRATVKRKEINGRGTICADYATPHYSQVLVLTSPKIGGRSVGIDILQTKSHRVRSLFLSMCRYYSSICRLFR